MQFFLLLLFNVFLGAVMYLIISLKLERSATEFRERKLRKEMDEVIQEFNATAERNISILENRIKLLRKLLDKGGDIKLLDVIIDEEKSFNVNDKSRMKTDTRGNRDAEAGAGFNSLLSAQNGPRDNNPISTKKGLPLFIEKIINKLQYTKDMAGEEYSGSSRIPEITPVFEQALGPGDQSVSDRKKESLIEKDLSVAAPPCRIEEEKAAPLSEDEIMRVISSAGDKYAMVSILKEKGCAIEDISHYSGIPVGEVRLVLNLNNAR